MAAAAARARRAAESKERRADRRELSRWRDRLLAYVVQGNVAEAEELLGRAPVVEARTSFGLSALGVAAAGGDAAMCAMLLEAGANIAAADSLGATPLIMAAYRGHGPVVAALLGGRAGGAAGRGLLLRQATTGGETAFMAAAKAGHLDVARALAAAGADVRATTPGGLSAAMLAARHNRVAALEALLSPEFGLPLGATDAGGRTALMHAAAGGAALAVGVLARARLPAG